MKPVSFEHHAPKDPAQAVELLAEYGDDAQLLAGGQSLMPLLNFRLASPSVVVDINGLTGYSYYHLSDDTLTVGALCRDRDIEYNTSVCAGCAAIADAVPQIGHVAVRNRGTVVGSIAHADPSAEWPTLALLLDATIQVAGRSGERTANATDFFKGPFSVELSPEEMITQVQFPLPTANWGSSFVELGRRDGDFALVGVGTVLDLTPDNTVRNARIALSGVGDRPTRAVTAESALKDQPADDESFAAAAAGVTQGLDPPSDVHGSGAYRQHLVEVLTRRGLQLALRRANESGEK